jgi:hypothetical protein
MDDTIKIINGLDWDEMDQGTARRHDFVKTVMVLRIQ